MPISQSPNANAVAECSPHPFCLGRVPRWLAAMLLTWKWSSERRIGNNEAKILPIALKFQLTTADIKRGKRRWCVSSGIPDNSANWITSQERQSHCHHVWKWTLLMNGIRHVIFFQNTHAFEKVSLHRVLYSFQNNNDIVLRHLWV